MSSYLCFSRRELHKCSTQPLLLQTSPKFSTLSTIHSSSSSSIQSDQQEYRKLSIKWILDFQRKLTKDTNHLAVWYFQLSTEAGLTLKESNWQLICATTILLATKMNQIYPPSINSIIKRCNSSYLKNYPINKSSILGMEQQILKLLNFNIAQQSPYSLIVQKLQERAKQALECQKLLKVVYPFKDICKNSSQSISNSIIYLISRNISYFNGMNQYQIKQIKTLSDKIYHSYKKVKTLHEQKKNKQLSKFIINQSKENHQSNYLKLDSIQQCKQSINNLLNKHSHKDSPEMQILKEKSMGLYSKQSMRFSYKNLYMYA